MRLVAVLLLASAACHFEGHSETATDGNSSGSDAGRHDAGARDAVLPLDAPPDASPPMIRFVQSLTFSPDNWNSAASSIAVGPIDTTAGDLLAVYVSAQNTVSSVTDDGGDTFTSAVTSGSIDGQKSSAYYAPDLVGGPVTVTAHFGSSCCRVIIVHEISGASLTAPLDAADSKDQSNVDTTPDAVAGNVKLLAAGDYLFAGTSDASNQDGQIVDAGTGFTRREHFDNATTNGNATATEDEILTGSASTRATFTIEQDGADTLTLMMAFKL